MAATGDHSNVLDDQARLSEHLQLLDHFLPLSPDALMPYSGVGEHSYKRSRDPDTNTDIRLLDTIAVALTTGKSGDAFDAAFDRRQRLTLVLAKNDPHTDEDDEAVSALIKAITASTTKTCHVFPFLLSRCGENITRRMMKMVEAVTAFSRSLDEILKDYTPALSVEEFPRSAEYRREMYPDGDPSFPEMMRDLLADITQAAEEFDSTNFDVAKDSFTTLTVLILLLQKSHLLLSLCDVTNSMRLRCDLHWQAARLNRCLAKVSQYYHGINDLIRRGKQFFKDDIPYRWVSAIEGMVTLCPLEQALGDQSITSRLET